MALKSLLRGAAFAGAAARPHLLYLLALSLVAGLRRSAAGAVQSSACGDRAGSAPSRGLCEELASSREVGLELLQRDRHAPARRISASSSEGTSAKVPADSTPRLSVAPRTKLLYDETGRTHIFHGVNVVYKEFPWYPPSDKFSPEASLTDEDMARLQDWGFNVVRLGVMWPGVEPSPGLVNETYLQEVLSITRRLAKHGIYTLVDFHQDLLSRHFCGEGVPEFYIEALLADNSSELSKAPNFPWSSLLDSAVAEENATWIAKLLLDQAKRGYPLDENGMPYQQDCDNLPFLLYYLTDRVQILQRELFRKGTPLNTGAVEYWRNVARTFAQEPHIVGFELMNEPDFLCDDFLMGGNCSDVKAWMTRNYGLRYMGPFYEQLVDAIRGEGATQPIFFEMPWNVPFDPTLKESRSLEYSYHAYCLPGDDGTNYLLDGICSLVQAVQDTWISMLRYFPPMQQGFVTEFGAVGDSEAELDHMSNWLDFADSMLESWAYWEFKKFKDITTQNAEESFYDNAGNLEVRKLRALTRTYAKATAGLPTSMYYSRGSEFFSLRFLASAVARSKGAPTDIYLNEALHYPYGYEVSVVPSGCTAQEFVKNHVYVFLTQVTSFKMMARCSFIEVSIRAKTLIERAIGKE